MELWAGCVAGALEENEYRAKLAAAGLGDISIEFTSVYDAGVPGAMGKFASAFVGAVRP